METKVGNCIEEMKLLPDKSFDLVLTDPPYNAKNIGPNAREYSLGQMQLPQEEYIKFCQDWFKEARRVGKTLVFTPGIANVCYYPQPDWIICWHKPAAVSFNRFGGFNAWEPILVYGKIAKGKRLGQDYLLVHTMNFSRGIETGHPCPKPLELWEILIDKFSNEGNTVLDPFMGSGTTAVVCRKFNRKCAGYDINPEYVEMTQQRVNHIPESLFV